MDRLTVTSTLSRASAQGIGAGAFDQGYVGQLCTRLDVTVCAGRCATCPVSACDVVGIQLLLLTALPAPPDLVTCAAGTRTPMPRLMAPLRARIAGRRPAR